jgi:hypothetical protein
MRHFYKSHGKHCYLRSFKTSCPTCGADVLYWECTHGSKIFFEYPPYGKLVKHYCRKHLSSKSSKNKFKVIVKTPNRLFENSNISCPICGRIFTNNSSLDDHLKMLKKTDPEHKQFFNDRIKFSREQRHKNNEKQKENNSLPNLKFGQVNIKKFNKNTS